MSRSRDSSIVFSIRTYVRLSQLLYISLILLDINGNDYPSTIEKINYKSNLDYLELIISITNNFYVILTHVDINRN